jgi:hypothetical protein
VSTKLLCNVMGMILELEGQEVLLLKNPLSRPFQKSKDGFGMLSPLEELRKRHVVAVVSEMPGGGLFVDWPDSVPARLRPKTILASDLSPLQWFEDGTVVEGFGNS